MTVSEFLLELSQLGIYVTLEGKELEISFPKDGITEEKILEIKSRKREILDFLSKSRAPLQTSFFKMTKAPLEEYYPLSPAQRGIYFIQRLHPRTTGYNMPLVIDLDNNVNAEGFQKIFQCIVDRHEVLRTSFFEIDDQPVQFVREETEFKLDYFEVKESESDQALKQYVRPFDLAKDLLFRAGLFHLDNGERLLVVDIHHIISDGITAVIIEDEFLSLLKGLALPELKWQYKDYAQWQNDLLALGAMDEQKSYWIELLSGERPKLSFLTDRPRPKNFTFEGGVHEFSLSGTDMRNLKELGSKHRATLFMNILTILNVLIYKYTKEEDLMIGTVVAGRRNQDLQNVAGLFVNTLAMRNSISGSYAFDDFLAEVVKRTLRAFDNQDIPFEAILEDLPLHRDQSRNNQLFDVSLTVQNYEQTSFSSGIQSSGTPENTMPGYHQTSKLDLNFLVEESDDHIGFTIEYYAAIFDAETLVRLEQHFRKVLETVSNNPDIEVDEIDLLTTEEAQRVLNQFNKDSLPDNKNGSVLELYHKQVLQVPDKNAIVEGQTTLSYGELDSRVNEILNTLVNLNIEGSSKVAVVMERSADLIASMIAIWKNACVFVPIDPGYPLERIQYILEDAEVSALLTKGDHVEQIPGNSSFRGTIIDLNDVGQKTNGNSTGCAEIRITAEEPAYLIYTSGTTGKPKGVMVSHGALLNLVNWHTTAFDVSVDSKATSLASIGFDAFIWEICPYLSVGACLYPLKDETRLAMEKLIEFIRINQISHCFLPTGLVLPFVDISRSLSTDLDYLLTGGESLGALDSSDLDYTIVNNYGPTENAVVTTSYTIDSNFNTDAPPIGKPIDNVQVYIVDDRMNILPIGMVGELIIGGGQVAMGYLNDKKLTDQRFVPDDFGVPASGHKLYRTGDLAKWRSDGNIEYVGRVDSQVKIRGHRIELGEIENILLTHTSVDQCVVDWKTDSTKNKYLLAYVVCSGHFEQNNLFKFIRQKLPEYMLPNQIIEIPHIPLTPNGKTDKSALPDPGARSTTTKEDPKSDIEKLVAKNWAGVLGLDVGRIGLNSNFFDIGGHSLLAISSMSLLKKELGLEISVMDMFNHPTVAGLANQIEKLSDSPPVIEIGAQKRPKEIPLSFSQERLWLIDKMKGSVDYHISTAIRIVGPLNLKAMEFAFKNIVSRHEILRTVYREENSSVYQTVMPKDHVKMEIDTGYTKDQQLDQYVTKLVLAPFDLAHDPMVRVAVIPLSPNENILVVVIHHIASDGWSQSLLMSEFVELYLSRSENRPFSLEKLPIQYADYALWQSSQEVLEGMDSKLEYWKENLMGATSLRLPSDIHQDLESQDHSKDLCESIEFLIEKKQCDKLRALATREETTLFTVFVAAFNILLSRYSGQKDICVGTPVANRLQKEVEPLIGFFLNTIVLRCDLSANPTFINFIAQVKETILAGFSRQDVPFERVVESTLNTRDQDTNPLFQVMINMLNFKNTSIEIPGLEIEWLEEVKSESKFDITLYLSESTCGGYVATFDYRASKFSKSHMNLMTMNFQELLTSITTDPSNRIGTLNMLTEQEKKEQKSRTEDFFA